jgi:hypothetical protein
MSPGAQLAPFAGSRAPVPAPWPAFALAAERYAVLTGCIPFGCGGPAVALGAGLGPGAGETPGWTASEAGIVGAGLVQALP